VRTADPAKVQRIIDAAFQLFAERPFHEVRMDDIAERAKVSKGTLYLHFKDKDDLYRALILEGLKGLATRLEECSSGTAEPEEELLELNRQSIRYLERNHFFLQLFQRVEIARGGCAAECFAEPRSRLDRVLAKVIREFPSKSKLSENDLKVEVLAITGMMNEIVHGLPRPWPDDLAERITGLIVHGIYGKLSKVLVENS
jgi:AcrR family transcriptional regulator